MAIRLFRACNENATDELVEQFYYYYEVYQNSKHAAHLGIYFDLKEENTYTSTVHVDISSK